MFMGTNKQAGFGLFSIIVTLTLLSLVIAMLTHARGQMQITKAEVVRKGQYVDLREYFRNQLDCEETVAQANCQPGEPKTIAAVSCDGSPITDQAFTRMGKNAVRLRCGLPGDPERLVVETAQINEDGELAVNKFSGETSEWRDLFHGIPICTGGSSTTTTTGTGMAADNQVTPIYLHDMCYGSLCSPGGDNDSGVLIDRCNQSFPGGSWDQENDHWIQTPATVQNLKTPVFEGENVTAMLLWTGSHAYHAYNNLTFHMVNSQGERLWTFHRSKNTITDNVANLPEGAVESRTHCAKVGGKVRNVYRPEPGGNCEVFRIPITEDGFIVFEPNERHHQYIAVVVEHVLNPQLISGTATRSSSGYFNSCGAPASRIEEITSQIPISCRERARRALAGTESWRN